MITEQEAREALQIYKDGTTPTVRGFASLVVIDWAVQELSRRDAERAERAKPIDAEWLKSVGAKKRAINRWRLCDQCNLWLRENCLWTVRVDGYTVVVTTRGQLLDLLAALKGGA